MNKIDMFRLRNVAFYGRGHSKGFGFYKIFFQRLKMSVSGHFERMKIISAPTQPFHIGLLAVSFSA